MIKYDLEGYILSCEFDEKCKDKMNDALSAKVIYLAKVMSIA
jgi:hypothetical protein